MTAKRWSIYVLECSDGTLYTGISTDVSRRVRQHNGEIRGGARYTRSRRPVKLLAARPVGDQSLATREERRFKKLRRVRKLEELSTWVDDESY